MKYIKSKYKHVKGMYVQGVYKWSCTLHGDARVRKWVNDEKEAAKMADITLIKRGKPPVNILKKIDS